MPPFPRAVGLSDISYLRTAGADPKLRQTDGGSTTHLVLRKEGTRKKPRFIANPSKTLFIHPFHVPCH